MIALRVFALDDPARNTVERGKSDVKLFSKVTTEDHKRITIA